MIINDHLPDIESRLGDGEFLRPDYAKYSFGQIPALIELLLGEKKEKHPLAEILLAHVDPEPQNVILLMIDGFGYNQWLKYGEKYPFLSRLLEKGYRCRSQLSFLLRPQLV